MIPSAPTSRFLTIAEVARTLGLSQQSVRRRIQKGALRALRVVRDGREVLVVSREELERDPTAHPFAGESAPSPVIPAAAAAGGEARLERVERELAPERCVKGLAEEDEKLLARASLEDTRQWNERLRTEIGHKRSAEQLVDALFASLDAALRRERRVTVFGLLVLFALFALVRTRERDQHGALERLQGALAAAEVRSLGASTAQRRTAERLAAESEAHESVRADLLGLELEHERLLEVLRRVRSERVVDAARALRFVERGGSGPADPLAADPGDGEQVRVATSSGGPGS